MKIEKQVCSLELSDMILDLGIEVDSLFRWFERIDNGEYFVERSDYFAPHMPSVLIGCPAYTVSELGEMLPRPYSSAHLKDGIAFNCRYDDASVRRDYAETEADARAKMLIWLIENNHVDVAQVNEGAE